MACGCKGGKWTPAKATEATTASAASAGSALKGPQAPGYYATYNGPAPKPSS